MKTLLAVLSLLSISATASAEIISCGSDNDGFVTIEYSTNVTSTRISRSATELDVYLTARDVDSSLPDYLDQALVTSRNLIDFQVNISGAVEKTANGFDISIGLEEKQTKLSISVVKGSLKFASSSKKVLKSLAAFKGVRNCQFESP